MRRTIFLALLATLLLVPSARAANTIQIIRDCDDGVLQGHYTPAELRKARSNLPTDVDEYSDCRDVLSRAIAAGTDSSRKGSSSGGSGGGGGAGSSGGSGGSGGGGNAATNAGEPPAQVAPTTPQDQAALTEAASSGDGPVRIDGRPVIPGGTSRLAADVGRNSVPTTLILVLVLIAAAALAAAAPRLRARVAAHRQS